MRTYWINRTLCDVLEDMRKCHETRNYTGLIGLIEEAQAKGNRMESALENKKDLNEMEKEWHEKRKELKKLKKEVEELNKKLDVEEK